MPELDTIALKRDEARYAFEVQPVGVVKRTEVRAIRVEDTQDDAVPDQRDHDLRTGKAAARDVTGEGFDVFDDQGFRLCPTGPAHALTLADTRARDGSLEGTQHQLVLFDEVEPHPQPSELFLERTRDVGQVRDEVWFSIEEPLDLRPKPLILFYLRSDRNV